MDIEEYRIHDAPPTMYYIPDFISEDEEQHILSSIPSNRWINLSHRRLQAIPARLSATNTLLASPLPKHLFDPILPRFKDLNIFQAAPHGVNHCLINEYLPGQGIMPHEDGAAYWPVVATVSLGGAIVLDVSEKSRRSEPSANGRDEGQGGAGKGKQWKILQEPRSLLVTSGDAYTETLHGIADVHADYDLNEKTVANWTLLGSMKGVIAGNGGTNERTTRVSLTYRDVKKVSTVGSKIFGRTKT
ncbi:Hypothetical protein R9X50_00165700 [Acrodontium crateriforme]|uniref:Fe2OG dioxygenase domain-containing protein n=1 Tax=Acrodontium crateriforme TaxID=150365 RepID=A0AAQ3R8D8_9PEZI|nr:Hypothetical protein R9X50_00165700 [Acrodontium crateriforme]